MKPGDTVTIISPLGILNHKGKMQYTAKRGIYKGWRNGMRIIQHSDGGQTHIERGGETRLTTKKVDIGPCGLLE